MPIITTGGLLHGIQTTNHPMQSAVPQTSLTSPVLSPQADDMAPNPVAATSTTTMGAMAGSTVTRVQKRAESTDKSEAFQTEEEEREDICLLT